MAQVERDFPLGHPKASDTVLGSPEHIEWTRLHAFHENKRDFPPGHPKAVDTPGHTNAATWEHGVDPYNPHKESFTGLLPEQAAAVAEWNREEAAGAHESPVLPLVDANVVNEALAAERKRLGVETLNGEQYSAVLKSLGAVESPVRAAVNANVVGEALAAERKRLGVRWLNEEQYSAVLKSLGREQ